MDGAIDENLPNDLEFRYLGGQQFLNRNNEVFEDPSNYIEADMIERDTPNEVYFQDSIFLTNRAKQPLLSNSSRFPTLHKSELEKQNTPSSEVIVKEKKTKDTISKKANSPKISVKKLDATPKSKKANDQRKILKGIEKENERLDQNSVSKPLSSKMAR